MFQERKTDDLFDRTTVHKNYHVVRTVAAISMMLAAILLIVAIISLYSVSNPKAKLALVATYTLLFRHQRRFANECKTSRGVCHYSCVCRCSGRVREWGHRRCEERAMSHSNGNGDFQVHSVSGMTYAWDVECRLGKISRKRAKRLRSCLRSLAEQYGHQRIQPPTRPVINRRTKRSTNPNNKKAC